MPDGWIRCVRAGGRCARLGAGTAPRCRAETPAHRPIPAGTGEGRFRIGEATSIGRCAVPNPRAADAPERFPIWRNRSRFPHIGKARAAAQGRRQSRDGGRARCRGSPRLSVGRWRQKRCCARHRAARQACGWTANDSHAAAGRRRWPTSIARRAGVPAARSCQSRGRSRRQAVGPCNWLLHFLRTGPIRETSLVPWWTDMKSDHLPRHLALLLFAVVVLAWGFNWPVTKSMVQSIPPLWTAALRSLVASVVLLALLWGQGNLIVPRRGDLPVMFGIALPHMVAFSGLVAIGIQFVPAGRAIVLGYTTPLWVIPASRLFLGEP